MKFESYIKRYFWFNRLRKEGVKISNTCKVLGHTGISIKSGTEIHSNTTLACSYLNFEDCFLSFSSGSISVGTNCLIHSGSIIATYGGNIILSDQVSINPGTIIYGHGGISIGKMTRIAANCTLIAANHNFNQTDKPIMAQGLSTKGIFIDDDVWIGTHCVILDGVRVGKGSVIAAGAVVTKDVAPYSVVAGVPARLLKFRQKQMEYTNVN
jgi:acetyltransferase-like isoleucine patch superfamily enzyme